MKFKLVIVPLALSLIAATPTTKPTTRPMPPAIAAFSAAQADVRKVLPNVGVLRDPQQRAKIAPEAIPALKKSVTVLNDPDNLKSTTTIAFFPPYDIVARGELIALGESGEVDGVTNKYKQEGAIVGEFILADRNRQAAIANDLQSKLKADAEDQKVTQTILAIHFAADAGTPEIDAQLKKSVMDALAIRRAKAPDSAAITKAILNKPLVLEATLADGKQFSTASWKGKVVLVDFWATWCGPCKAGLPHVKEIYKAYHDKGLEIIGVSNDYKGEDLTKFLAADPEMAWPQFFDPKSAEDHAWHPITQKYGVDTIPRMFLIDRDGICRSITARQDMDVLIPKLLGISTTQAAASDTNTKRTTAEISADVMASRGELAKLFGKEKLPLKTAADRAAIAPQAIPVLNQIYAKLDELADSDPKLKQKVLPLQQQCVAELSVLGDKSATDRIAAMVASNDSAEVIKGQSDLLLVRWLEAEKTVPTQTPIVDDVEKLDRANPGSEYLTAVTVNISSEAASPELMQRMLTIASEAMDNPTAASIKKQLAAKQAAAEKAAAAGK